MPKKADDKIYPCQISKLLQSCTVLRIQRLKGNSVDLDEGALSAASSGFTWFANSALLSSFALKILMYYGNKGALFPFCCLYIGTSNF